MIMVVMVRDDDGGADGLPHCYVIKESYYSGQSHPTISLTTCNL